MASPKDIIIIGGGGDRLAEGAESTSIKIRVPSGITAEQAAQIVQAVLEIVDGEVITE